MVIYIYDIRSAPMRYGSSELCFQLPILAVPCPNWSLDPGLGCPSWSLDPGLGCPSWSLDPGLGCPSWSLDPGPRGMFAHL